MICERTQGYYENGNGAYAAWGMKGHGAIDVVCGYGSPIECPLDGVVYKILDKDRPANDGTGYWGIFMISEYKGQVGELCVGHCSKINIEIGQKVTKGQTIGQEGNKGLVFSGGVQITKAMQEAGDKRGSHRHWQWRPLRKTRTFNAGNPKLISYPHTIYKDTEGFYYEILDYYNGYNGLSESINGILNDFIDWKIEEAINRNVEVPVEVKSRLSTVLSQLKEILLKLKMKL